jgi:hypothetical protein
LNIENKFTFWNTWVTVFSECIFIILVMNPTMFLTFERLI